MAGVDRILSARQEMVGGVERDEALRVLRRREYSRGVVDADDCVARRVHHHERSSQPRDDLAELLFLDVVEKLLPDAERAAGDVDHRFAFGFDRVERIFEQA